MALNNRYSLRLLLALSLTVGLVSLPGTLAQAPAQYQGGVATGVSMTLFHVLTSASGQQFYLKQYGQAVALPGEG